MQQPLISINQVSKRYGDRKVLDGVSLDIHAGETVALIGPSGGGKSTLLRAINGLVSIDDGTIRVGEHELIARTPVGSRRALMLRREVGMVFQDFQLFPHLTALGNVIESPMRVLGKSRVDAEHQARELLERVGLGDRADAWPAHLSGGQKQRVAIARALAMQPRALLCDEITSALDPELKHEVLETLADLRREGMTLVVVTHEMGFARRVADRVVVLADAHIIEESSPDQLFTNPQHLRTKQFLENVLA